MLIEDTQNISGESGWPAGRQQRDRWMRIITRLSTNNMVNISIGYNRIDSRLTRKVADHRESTSLLIINDVALGRSVGRPGFLSRNYP